MYFVTPIIDVSDDFPIDLLEGTVSGFEAWIITVRIATNILRKSETGMGLAQTIGLFAWQFALAILPSSAWLVVCRLIPRLRRRVGISYCIAAVLIVMSCLLTHAGLTPMGLLAGGVAGAILGVRWRRALKLRSLEVNTIISYHDHDRM